MYKTITNTVTFSIILGITSQMRKRLKSINFYFKTKKYLRAI